MNSSSLLHCLILSAGLLSVAQTTVAQVRPVTIADNTVLGFQGPNVSVGETDRSNKVFFFGIDTRNSRSSLTNFVKKDYSITDKQNFGNVTRMGNCVVVTASRQNSGTPVNWLKNIIYKDYANNPVEKDPEKLNFALTADLILDAQHVPLKDGGNYTGQLTCKNVALAQGHTNTQNDWWMYSNLDTEDNKGGLNLSHGQTTITMRCEGERGENYNVSWAMYGNSASNDNEFLMTGMSAIRPH
jgi:hypothetical protein